MYINYFILEAGVAGFCWYAALWFYPLNLAGIKKVLRNHTTMQTHNCVENRRRWFGEVDKAQLSLIEFLYCGAAWGSSDTNYANVIYRHLNICLKKRLQMALKMHTEWMYVQGCAAVGASETRGMSPGWDLIAKSCKGSAPGAGCSCPAAVISWCVLENTNPHVLLGVPDGRGGAVSCSAPSGMLGLPWPTWSGRDQH